MRIDLIPLTATDREITELLNMYNTPSTEIYISISDDYFDYVTSTEDIVYYKIAEDGILTGGIHCEIDGETMSLSICVKEEYRRRGIAEAALRKLLFALPEKVNIIEVSIDEIFYQTLYYNEIIDKKILEKSPDFSTKSPKNGGAK